MVQLNGLYKWKPMMNKLFDLGMGVVFDVWLDYATSVET